MTTPLEHLGSYPPLKWPPPRVLQVLAHHGRWDRMCPPETALESYQRRLAGAQLRWLVDENLGHACARGRWEELGDGCRVYFWLVVWNIFDFPQ